jgi:hypothetical protein
MVVPMKQQRALFALVLIVLTCPGEETQTFEGPANLKWNGSLKVD